MMKWIKLVLGMFFVIVMYVGCSPQVEQVGSVRPVVLFELGGAGSGHEQRSYTGTVTARESAVLAFEVQGRLSELRAVEGARVKRGDVLARIEPEDYRARLEAARARLRSAREDFERQAGLYERGAVSAARLQQARTTLDVAAAEQSTLEKALENTELKAPFDGSIGRLYVDNFQNVQAKEPVVLMQNLDSLQIEVSVPERDMAKVPRGRPLSVINELIDVKATFDGLSGFTVPLQVIGFSTEADAVTRTFKVTLGFEPPADQTILPGMTATVTATGQVVEAPRGEGFEVPVTVVAYGADGSHVWLLKEEDMTVRRVPVQTGEMSSDSVRIYSEQLRPGDEVVAAGVRFLTEGMKVARMEH